MNKSRYKLYKQGKKWVITAVAATSIGIGGDALISPKVHADIGPIAGLPSQTVVNDSEFYKIADRLRIAAENNSILTIGDKPNYESFKAALAAYEIIKDTHSIMRNDLSILARSNTGIPYYLTENQLDLLQMRFDEINSSMMDAYYHHDNSKVLNDASDYVNVASNITRMYNGSKFEPRNSSAASVGSLSSKFGEVAQSASHAIGSVVNSYSVYKNGVGHSASSAMSSSAPVPSDNVTNSAPNNDALYWQNMANSLNAEMNKKNDVTTMAPSSSNDFNTTTSAAASSASSATSSAATSSSATSSSANDFLYISHDSIASSSAASTSHSSSAKPKKDVYKNFYLSLKKKAAKEVIINQNKVAKYKDEYKNAKNKQQKSKKLKQYRDAKNKLNASQKHLKSLNAKSLKY